MLTAVSSDSSSHASNALSVCPHNDITLYRALACRNVQRHGALFDRETSRGVSRIFYLKLYRAPVDIPCNEKFLYEVICKINYFSLHSTL